MPLIHNLPSQQLPFSKKTKEWRKKHLDWAEGRTYFTYSPVRNSVTQKKINYDLINGVIHMQDLGMIVNPDNLEAGFIPEKIQHYPIINKSLNVLRGEEMKRVFDGGTLGKCLFAEGEYNHPQDPFQKEFIKLPLNYLTKTVARNLLKTCLKSQTTPSNQAL